ncbi:hypothetical protein LINPERHAP2_LOCUS26884 [Linum perenne]
MECCKSPWLVFAILCIIQLRAFAQLPPENVAPATGVKVTSDNTHVRTDYKVVTEKEDVVEVSFSRTWSPGQPNTVVPLNVDMRYIVRKGVPGFYIYVIVERLKGWPDVDMNYHRYAFKPNKTLFNYMAITDEIQLVMPTEADRQAGKPLAYKEAVKLTNPVSNPAFKDQVDDKYEYTLEKTELKLKGWVSDSAKIGFWVIAPSDEYMNGGPKKNDLTCHCGPTVVVIFTSIHTFGLDLLTEYRNGEPWKKAFGPILVYLNSDADHSALWKDAKSQELQMMHGSMKSRYRQYGLWLQYPVVYPKDDVVFQVGVSNYSKDWFFAHVLRAAGNTYNPTIWRVVFDLPEVSPTGNYTIQIALAAAEMTNTYVYVNDVNAKRPHYATGTCGTDNAIARHGNHGLYRFFSGGLPSNLFIKGKNTIFMRQARASNYAYAGVMYDYIRLEAPSSDPSPKAP